MSLLPEERPEGLDKPWVPTFIKAMSRANVWLYKKTGGRVGGKWILGGIPVALLTTRGRKSGLERVSPLLCYEDKEKSRFVVVGSQGGLPKNPAWVYNVRAEPMVSLQVGSRQHRVRARELVGQERDDMWEKLLEFYPDFANYARWTDRVIPVIALERP